jgi:hypothetical protein
MPNTSADIPILNRLARKGDPDESLSSRNNLTCPELARNAGQASLRQTDLGGFSHSNCSGASHILILAVLLVRQQLILRFKLRSIRHWVQRRFGPCHRPFPRRRVEQFWQRPIFFRHGHGWGLQGRGRS